MRKEALLAILLCFIIVSSSSFTAMSGVDARLQAATLGKEDKQPPLVEEKPPHLEQPVGCIPVPPKTSCAP